MTQPWPLWGSKSSHGTVLNFYVTNYDSYTTDIPWTFSVSNSNYKTIEQVCSLALAGSFIWSAGHLPHCPAALSLHSNACELIYEQQGSAVLEHLSFK